MPGTAAGWTPMGICAAAGAVAVSLGVVLLRARYRRAPPTLLEAVMRQTTRAMAAGAMSPLATRAVTITDGGVPFLVSVVNETAMRAKPKPRPGASAAAFDAFASIHEDLLVRPPLLFPRHNLVLNKFPVVRGHVVVVTREFEPQADPLTEHDLAALWACVDGMDGLGFFNAGRIAGASQPRKHTQVIPRAALAAQTGTGADGRAALPVERVLLPDVERLARAGGGVGRCAALPFAHAIAPVPAELRAGAAAGPPLRAICGALMTGAGVAAGQDHNLLMTREWMMIVPRRREAWCGVAVNGVGFAGFLLARGESGDAMADAGPMAALRAVVEGSAD